MIGSFWLGNVLCQLITLTLYETPQSSNVTVGGIVHEAVALLMDYAGLDPACIDDFYRLTRCVTCFDWETPLVELINKRGNNPGLTP